MNALWLSRLADVTKLLAALLFAATALRFATVSVYRVISPPAPAESGAAQSADTAARPARAARRLGQGHAAAAASGSARPHEFAGPGPKRARAVVTRMMLVVSAGPARSQVYVQGSRVGGTPYVGDVSCAEGEPVKVDVVPPRGMPLSFTRRCQSGATLRLE
jgi:hypothetical protein